MPQAQPTSCVPPGVAELRPGTGPLCANSALSPRPSEQPKGTLCQSSDRLHHRAQGASVGLSFGGRWGYGPLVSERNRKAQGLNWGYCLQGVPADTAAKEAKTQSGKPWMQSWRCVLDLTIQLGSRQHKAWPVQHGVLLIVAADGAETSCGVLLRQHER